MRFLWLISDTFKQYGCKYHLYIWYRKQRLHYSCVSRDETKLDWMKLIRYKYWFASTSGDWNAVSWVGQSSFFTHLSRLSWNVLLFDYFRNISIFVVFVWFFHRMGVCSNSQILIDLYDNLIITYRCVYWTIIFWWQKWNSMYNTAVDTIRKDAKPHSSHI